MKRKILITGGAGNVGGSLARRLVADPNNFVVVVDNLLTGSRTKLPQTEGENWRFIKADCNRMDEMAPIMCSSGFDYIFHYAAVVGVKRTLESPRMVLDDVKGIENVLGLAKSTGVRRVFYSSSSEVYGEPVEFPQRESTTPLNSRLPYAIVKNLGEAYFKSFYQEYGLEYTIFRFFNTYGPLQSTDFVMSRFLSQALTGEPLTIYGEGSQTRTFCYVEDNLDTVQKLLNDGVGVNEVINIGSDVEISMLDLARRIIEITGSKSYITHLPALTEGDMTRRLPDVTRMRSILGRDLTQLENGIRLTLRFQQEIAA
ncbi:NAD-dependent epimerase/dehydratase family protein [Polaromonas sp.]|uniref:NAD-dependent epimerase/dehydratase family protein n=1 Tax=Polaromonas sp. TaxID=1869339 RepID=UPI0025F09467|nr:NAD-dependent epimerase/dehydratase family protein [Polaromonas sp.]